MGNSTGPEKIDAIILCGGKGERLKDVVSDRPKPMADINGRPFLDILVDQVASLGPARVILCLGYKGELVRRYYENTTRSVEIVFSQEPKPLGTAGAVKNAAGLIKSNPFLVMNGDSFCPVDLRALIDFHKSKGAACSMTLAKAVKGEDYGAVRLDESQKVVGYNEKGAAKGGGLVNAGIYVFDRNILDRIDAGKRSSLEYDIFPSITGESLYGYVTKELMIDIGTPERYEIAKGRFKDAG